MKSIINRLLCIALVLASASSWAHEMRPALLTIEQSADLTYRAVFKQPQVQGRFLNLSVATNCETVLVKSRANLTALEETFDLICTEPLATIEIIGLERTLVDTMITIEDLDGIRQDYLVTGRAPKIDISRGVSTPVYFILGMEHLFSGIDHVMFVLLLVYLVNGWRNLVKVVTSFTIAHSLTLGLTAFNIVSVSQSPVEALIALSIILLAMETLRKSDSLIHQKPWLISFVFGLLHGLGFARALTEIGLPQSSIVMPLFLFNVGIEVAQLVIIAVILTLTFAVTRTGLKPTQSLTALPVYLIGGVSCYWFIDQSLQVLG